MIDIRQDFPILSREIYGKPLIYFDNAATTQKPRQVVEAVSEMYYDVNANVHRGVHFLSQQATERHETARETVRNFLNAKSATEIVFTRGTTESLNLVASSFGESFMHEGDEIIVSEAEHHSNIVPWQLLRDRKGIVLKVCPITEAGTLDLDALEKLFTPKTKLVSVCHVSNVLGCENPVEKIVEIAHSHGAFCLIDAAQSVPHMPIDVQKIDCDFLVFSGHKIYGPTGIGVLYGRESLLDRMTPYQGGGEMIARVTWEKTTYEQLPLKFEAGTPDYVGSHALAVALDYVQKIGLDSIRQYERELTQYAVNQMITIDGMTFYGDVLQKNAVLAFNVGDIHPLDLGTLLDRLGIAIRTGHHCAQPLMRHYDVESMARASFAFYNTREEIDKFVETLERIKKMF